MKRLSRLAGALLRAGYGLALPIMLLMLAGFALEFAEYTPLASLRHAQFDRYQRQMPRLRDDEPVVVVGVDSQSLTQYGQWPWPRELISRLSARILSAQPLALGLDLVFAEPDRYSPRVLREHLPMLPREALARLPDPDDILAKSLTGQPTVLAVLGLGNPLPGARTPLRPLPRLAEVDLDALPVARFPAALTSRPRLEHAAAGEGFINASPDLRGLNHERGVLRRVPMLALIEQQPFLPLSLEMVRQALGPHGTVVPEVDRHGLRGIRIGDYRLPLQSNGDLLIHFGKASSHYYLSAADVLAGIHPPEIFRSRFVIIGFNSAGLQDNIVTPLGDSLPGVDIHVQIIESLLNGDALNRTAWMPVVEMLALIGGGLLLILAIPVLRPRLAIATFLGLACTLIGVGYLFFYIERWLFDGPTLALLLGPLFVSLLGKSLIEADQQRRLAENALQLSREATARTAGELDAARRIQMGLLPDPDQLFAGETRFAIAALLEPARAVGGDYYDCFMLDANRLCCVIGDVSGKGIPASLFMAISKTLTGTLTRQHPDLGQAIRAVEHELNRENPEYLFVTTFIGILDLDSGRLAFVCAGHDAPLVTRQGTVWPIATEPQAGPPLCAIGDYPYATDYLQLEIGDRLCLFTDGLTEASNGAALFGKHELIRALEQGAELSLAELKSGLLAAVRNFESGQPPADDLTLLLLDYHGSQPALADSVNAD